MARWCSICGDTTVPIGVLTVAFKVTSGKDKINFNSESMGGARYVCKVCADKVFMVSVDAPTRKEGQK